MSEGTVPPPPFRVVARFRPISNKEKFASEQLALEESHKPDDGFPPPPPVLSDKDCSNIEIGSDLTDVIVEHNGTPKKFGADLVLGPAITQTQTHEQVSAPLVAQAARGVNATILAFGQARSGRTYSMFGPKNCQTPDDEGMVARSARALFDAIDKNPNIAEVTVKCHIFEVVDEALRDLLAPKTKTLQLVERADQSVDMLGLSGEYVTSAADVFDLLDRGTKNRMAHVREQNESDANNTAASNVRLVQEASTFVRFQIKLSMRDGSRLQSTLQFVDLVPSEPAPVSPTDEDQAPQKSVKQTDSNSIKVLKELVRDFSSGTYQAAKLKFRRSKLTMLLRNSLGGNALTTLLVTCSPHTTCADATISSMMFGQRAQSIQNKPRPNRTRSADQLQQMLAQILEEREVAEQELTAYKAACDRHDIFDIELPDASQTKSEEDTNGEDPIALMLLDADCKADLGLGKYSAIQVKLDELKKQTSELAEVQKTCADLTAELQHANDLAAKLEDKLSLSEEERRRDQVSLERKINDAEFKMEMACARADIDDLPPIDNIAKDDLQMHRAALVTAKRAWEQQKRMLNKEKSDGLEVRLALDKSKTELKIARKKLQTLRETKAPAHVPHQDKVVVPIIITQPITVPQADDADNQDDGSGRLKPRSVDSLRKTAADIQRILNESQGSKMTHGMNAKKRAANFDVDKDQKLIFEGVLERKSGFAGGWQNRYLVIKTNQLEFYKNKNTFANSTPPQDVIYFDSRVCAYTGKSDDFDHTASVVESEEDKCIFKIKDSSQFTYKFRARSDTLAEKWIKLVTETIENRIVELENLMDADERHVAAAKKRVELDSEAQAQLEATIESRHFRVGDWTAFLTEDQREYYYNVKTQETTWQNPEESVRFDETKSHLHKILFGGGFSDSEYDSEAESDLDDQVPQATTDQANGQTQQNDGWLGNAVKDAVDKPPSTEEDGVRFGVVERSNASDAESDAGEANNERKSRRSKKDRDSKRRTHRSGRRKSTSAERGVDGDDSEKPRKKKKKRRDSEMPGSPSKHRKSKSDRSGRERKSKKSRKTAENPDEPPPAAPDLDKERRKKRKKKKDRKDKAEKAGSDEE